MRTSEFGYDGFVRGYRVFIIWILQTLQAPLDRVFRLMTGSMLAAIITCKIEQKIRCSTLVRVARKNVSLNWSEHTYLSYSGLLQLSLRPLFPTLPQSSH